MIEGKDFLKFVFEKFGEKKRLTIFAARFAETVSSSKHFHDFQTKRNEKNARKNWLKNLIDLSLQSAKNEIVLRKYSGLIRNTFRKKSRKILPRK